MRHSPHTSTQPQQSGGFSPSLVGSARVRARAHSAAGPCPTLAPIWRQAWTLDETKSLFVEKTRYQCIDVSNYGAVCRSDDARTPHLPWADTPDSAT